MTYSPLQMPPLKTVALEMKFSTHETGGADHSKITQQIIANASIVASPPKLKLRLLV